MPPRSLLTPALQSGAGDWPTTDEENPPDLAARGAGGGGGAAIAIPGHRGPPAPSQTVPSAVPPPHLPPHPHPHPHHPHHPSPVIGSMSRSFFGGGAPLLSSSLSHSHYLVGEHMQHGARGRPHAAGAASAIAASAVSTAGPPPASAGAGRRRVSEDPLTAPLLQRTSSAGAGAALFGGVRGGGAGSRRSSFEQRPAAAAAGASPIGGGAWAAVAAAAAAPPPFPSGAGPAAAAAAAADSPDFSSSPFSLALARAQAAHDPVLAAAIADTESSLVERAQREEEEAEEEAEARAQREEAEEAQHRAAASSSSPSSSSRRPRRSSPSSLSLAARLAAFAGPTARTDIIYGVINATVGIPAMVSFAAIVFVHPTYKPALGQLARFSFLSAAVHQLCFAAMSSLKFAVGQPQDTGLILLSAIATSVADIGLERGLSARTVVATALVATAASTLFVGLGTLGVARLRLAGLVQYVPLPVVGGYLSFVGWFCLVAGIGLGAGVELGAPSTWLALFSPEDGALPKLAATLAAAAAILACMRRARSPWALPALLGAIPLLFHAVLLATGTTLAQAQEAGWVIRPPSGDDDPSSSSSASSALQPFWQLYELFGAPICLPALAAQIPRAVALWFIVVFGSTLDIAAIQASTPEPLDYNRELGMVGASNVVCALTGGGFTGSYLFSQTAFSMKGGVGGPLHGLIIGGLELLVFLLPIPVVQLLPNFFIGALLAVFGVEITMDWLVHSRGKVTRSEYFLLVATFALVVRLGLGGGVAAGAAMCLAYFAFSYSRVHLSAFRVFSSRSAAARPLREHRALEGAFAGRMAAVSLSGFVFFGSSVEILDRAMALAKEMVAAAAATTGGEGGGEGEGRGGAAGADAATTATTIAAAALLEGGPRDKPPAALKLAPAPAAAASFSLSAAARRHLRQQQQLLLLRRVAAGAPLFLLLDFRRVVGVDATAAQTFGTLRMQLRRLGVELVLTRVHGNPTIERLFAAHGLIAPPSGTAATAATATAAGAGGLGGRSISDGGTAGEQRGDDDDDNDGASPPLPGSSSSFPDLVLEPGPEQGYCRHFDTLNDAARYAEERFLALARAAGALPAQDEALTLREFLAGHLLLPPGGGGGGGGDVGDEGEAADDDKEEEEENEESDGGKRGDGDGDNGRPSFGFAALGGSRRAVDAAAEGIARRSRVARFSAGQVLFEYGAAPDVVYLILKGQVDVEVHGAQQQQAAASPAATTTAAGVLASAAAGFAGDAGAPTPPAPPAVPRAFASSSVLPPPLAPRHFQCGVGAVVGGTDAVLQRPRAFRAVAASAVVEAVEVTSRGYRQMAEEAPAAARALQAILLRDACLGEVYAYEALRRAAD